MKLNFTKMHGCGNDYIYFDCFDKMIENPEELSVRLSDRHFSIGGDGIVLICPSEVADGKMRMFNIDGSEGKMCGNAVRCVGKYLHDVRKIDKDVITVETLSGIKTLKLSLENGETVMAQVDMGAPILGGKDIPTTFDMDKVVSCPLVVDGSEYKVTCVSMGNPHCIVFVDSPFSLELEKIGPKFENNAAFPERINTEFIKVINDHEIEMRVWERGSGETLACGTGACAAVVACVLNGFCPRNEEIKVNLRGGSLYITWTEESVIMKGGAEIAFTGEVEI